MSSVTARAVSAVLTAPALLIALVLTIAVTADLPQLGAAALGAPVLGVALLALLGAVIAAIVGRSGAEHRGHAPPRPRQATAVCGGILVVVSALALALSVSPPPAETAIAEVPPPTVIDDSHHGHLR